MSEKVLEVINVHKSFDKTKVLKGVSFDLEKGQSLSIIGPSGSGKSTIIRLINMLETVDSGEILMLDDYICKDENGKCTYNTPDNLNNLRKKYGMVFQNFNLFPHMTVLDNVAFALKEVQGHPKDEAEQIAKSCLDKVELSAKYLSYPQQLSGGQQQRVAIARALALNPEILFFDEPTSALDPELTKEVLNVILALVEKNLTMVIVTHEMSLARASDRVIMMEDGQIIHECKGFELTADTDNQRVRDFLSIID